jgi:hypothetical protein
VALQTADARLPERISEGIGQLQGQFPSESAETPETASS